MKSVTGCGWALAGLGFIGHLTYSMTFGGNYHFK